MESSRDNTDSVNVTIDKPARVLYFSDGVEEEIEEEQVSELRAEPQTADVNPSSRDNTDSVNVTIDKPARVLYFSDGVEEEIEEEQVSELRAEPQTADVNPKTLSWGPWFSYYTWKSGTKMLNAVDYAGETLAGFFGITTPKYQLEISEHERLQEEKRKMEEESVGWVPKNGGGDIPLVLNEPVKNDSKP